MKNRLFSIIFTAMVCAACSKETAVNDVRSQAEPLIKEASRDYIIKKGNHYCEQNDLEIMTVPFISAVVTFDSSAIYESVDRNNQADVNKLIGFSDCESQHHQNSARLGWSWNGKQVVIYAYAYVNAERVIKTLGGVEVNQAFSCSVNAGNSYYYFKAVNYSDSIPRHCTGNNSYRYKLLPYFGGDETAPHDIRISIIEE